MTVGKLIEMLQMFVDDTEVTIRNFHETEERQMVRVEHSWPQHGKAHIMLVAGVFTGKARVKR